MRKKTLISLSFALAFAFSSCSGGTSNDSSSSNSDTESYSSYVPRGEESIAFHYQRKNKSGYDKWALWLWPFGYEGKQFDFNYRDDYGAIAIYPLTSIGENFDKIGFIVKKTDNWTKDIDYDRYVYYNEFESDENNVHHVYLKEGDENTYIDINGNVLTKINKAEFISSRQIKVNTNALITSYSLFIGENIIDSGTLDKDSKDLSIVLAKENEVKFDESYSIEVTFKDGSIRTAPISVRNLYLTSGFNDDFTYDGELGAIYSPVSTTFKVWSPVSSKILLNIYESGDKDVPPTQYEMNKGENGVFEKELMGDLEGKYYTYSVSNSYFKDKEVVDPYAKSAGLNGKRGMIVDFSKTNPDNWEDLKVNDIDRKSLTVYETHVSDLTSASNWNGNPLDAKKYKGFYEEGTTYTKGNVTVKTGFDHIKELGVNAVQLLPVFDQDNNEADLDSFNWGYNPLNYNVVEGKYSSDPTDGYVRIKEFKTLIQKYTSAGINIIMDVVYNHVAGALESNFDVLMPGYYFRYNENGELSNGSGCGNETASELKMMRKFIVDSCKFWMEEYKLGGFRFDLMGIHDTETMERVSEECKKVFSNAYICGEPWSGGTIALSKKCTPANQDNCSSFKGYGAFNDRLRDGLIKGGLSGKSSLGWATVISSRVDLNDVERITHGIKGRTYLETKPISESPDTVTNYVTCHDNFTLHDRILAAGATSDESIVKKQAMLANSVVFSSLGTSFMLAGEEMLRTKSGDENSYQSSYEVNELNYDWKIEHLDMFNNYQRLISLKQSFEGLHKGKEGFEEIEVHFNSERSMIDYEITQANETYYFIHTNGTLKEGTTIDLSSYSKVYLDTLGKIQNCSRDIVLDKYQTLIVQK